MGYETFISPGEALRAKYRDQFPVTERLVYLNHAAVAPLSKRASEAMKTLADDACLYGSLHYEQWLDAYEGLRVAAAKLIGADKTEIAIVKNTSEGIATIASGIDWRPNDKIVAFREEFPANFLPWLRLEGKGVRVEWLSCFDSLDRIDQAARGARLLAVSYVQYLSGHRVDLDAIGEICDRHGVFFLVDAIQGMGAFPIDVRQSRIHALAADAHKWMLGPEGCGILYVQQDQQDSIEPVEFGWTNVAKYADYSSRDLGLRPDAGRYEPGTLNTIGCYGVRAALELILEMGVDEIGPAVQALADQIAEGARKRGYELSCERTPSSGAGIVSFRKEGLESRFVVHRLKEQGYLAAPRQGWIRVSPHFYIAPDEIEAMLGCLP